MTEPYDMVDLILAKRRGEALTGDQIRWMIAKYTAGGILDAQMSALTMAICFQGMTPRETGDLTTAMLESGTRMDYSDLGAPVVDKHSTGGVGDKVTLVLMPVVASFGVKVPQLSGRGLGHTGGTLDKLESIPGWRADLTSEEIREQLRTVGGMVCAAGADLAPADRRLYALRDATGTVDAIPLIASSIMSKKIAEGAQGLVLDVTTGSGAFLTDPEEARELARTMVHLGEHAGVRTRAILTDMSAPLGFAIGNANEVREAVQTLQGRGPADLVHVVCVLARAMLELAGLPDADPRRALADGSALRVWRDFVSAQGGDPDAALPEADHSSILRAEYDGVVLDLEARAFGVAAWRLGAGRSVPGAPVDHAAGIDLRVKPGDRVRRGDPICELHATDPDRLPRAYEALEGAVSIGDATRWAPAPLILGSVG